MKPMSIDSDKRLAVTLATRLGDILHTPKGTSIRLASVLGEGGEGAVYVTNTPYVAKVYKPEKTTTHKLVKIQAMASAGVNFPGISLPLVPLYNSRNEFVGYLMQKADGVKIRTLYQKPLLQKKFPHWTKRDLVELCVTILEKIDFLHRKGIILGDINPDNILVKTSREVYFVDCDSYQVAGYPCPVGTIPFTPRELQNRGHYGSYLRTVGNENFAVAVLLFSLMITGQMPYNQKGGVSAQQNIIDMDFSYPLGESSNKKTPNGPWRFLWSHLPWFLKDAFYNTFNRDGRYSTEGTRLSTSEWLKKFKEYLRLLDSGKLGEQDEMSTWVYPTRFKKQKGVVYVRCPCCKNEADKNLIDTKGYCVECLRKRNLVHRRSSGSSRVLRKSKVQPSLNGLIGSLCRLFG